MKNIFIYFSFLFISFDICFENNDEYKVNNNIPINKVIPKIINFILFKIFYLYSIIITNKIMNFIIFNY